jgi:hypothetical protein
MIFVVEIKLVPETARCREKLLWNRKFMLLEIHAGLALKRQKT